MKRNFLIILTLLMVMSFAGCGSKQDVAEPSSTTTGESEAGKQYRQRGEAMKKGGGSSTAPSSGK